MLLRHTLEVVQRLNECFLEREQTSRTISESGPSGEPFLQQTSHRMPQPTSARTSKPPFSEAVLATALHATLCSILVRPASPDQIFQTFIFFDQKKKVTRCFLEIRSERRRASKRNLRDSESSTLKSGGRLLCSLKAAEAARLPGYRLDPYRTGRL